MQMSVVGLVVLCIELEGSNTREVYSLVTDQLGKEEILFSYSDMKEWKLFAKNFPWVPKMKFKTAV